MRKPASRRQLHMIGAINAKAIAYHDDGRPIDPTEPPKVWPKKDLAHMDAAYDKRVRKAEKRLAERAKREAGNA